MKKTALLLLWLSLFLSASDDIPKNLNQFINQQIKSETILLDQNISEKEKSEIQEAQETAYKKFFIAYTSAKENHAIPANPYAFEIIKLQNQIKSLHPTRNEQQILLKKILLQQYELRNTVSQMLKLTIEQTKDTSKYLGDKISGVVAQQFAQIKTLDRTPYVALLEQNQTGKSVTAIEKELQTLDALGAATYKFGSELIDNSTVIYRTIKITESPLFRFFDNINSTPFGQKFNTFLEPTNIELGRSLFLALMILLVYLVNVIISMAIGKITRYYKLDDEDNSLVRSKITRLIHIITFIFIIHLIIINLFGLGDGGDYLANKLFNVLYIALFALLLYRLTGIIALFKTEELKQNKILKKEVINFVIKIIYALIILIAIVIILVTFGINITALLSGLGIGGIAVALAAKESIANIFGSVSILMGDIFEQGDWIEVGGVQGTVVEIGLRATTLRTFDNALASIPNYKLINEVIKNWNRRIIGRQIVMRIGVTYESEFSNIKNAIEEIRLMLGKHPAIAKTGTKMQFQQRSAKLVSVEDLRGVKRSIIVYMDEFADSSINIFIECFTRSVDRIEYMAAKEDIMFKIADILTKNHLDFAYPTLNIRQESHPSSLKEIIEE